MAILVNISQQWRGWGLNNSKVYIVSFLKGGGLHKGLKNESFSEVNPFRILQDPFRTLQDPSGFIRASGDLSGPFKIRQVPLVCES